MICIHNTLHYVSCSHACYTCTVQWTHYTGLCNSSAPPTSRSLASGALSLPSREKNWTNMKGLQFNLATYQRHVRNYIFSQAKKKVMKMTNGLYPAPLKIMEVRGRLTSQNLLGSLCGSQKLLLLYDKFLKFLLGSRG